MADLGFSFDPGVSAPPCDFADLPDLPALAELKRRRQWVAWKYEWRNGPDKKPTKPPISPQSGFGASHSKPSTWSGYRQACDFAERKDMPGVGYVLSHDDDLTGADLDDCRDPITGMITPEAAAIVALAETYVEVSPSGAGLRLIWRGKIASALKCDPLGIEVYGKQRYLTITGWHLPGTPDEIRPAPQTWAALQARVAAWKAENEAPAGGALSETVYPVTEQHQHVRAVPSVEARSSDGSPFFRNVNSAALARLSAWVPEVFGSSAVPQPGTGAYRITSKALGRNLEEDLSIAPTGCVDFGVHDMGDARQGKRTPVDLVLEYGGAPDAREAAFWLCSRLGRDPEHFGWPRDGAEAGATIAAGLLQARSVVESTDGTLADAETGEVIETTTTNDELPEAFANPPGLVGELAEWICDTSRRPQRGLAIGAALTIVGTAAGRHIAGPTRSGTHLYVVGLAPTGSGKDHPMQQILAALVAADAAHLIGPSQFISMPAVINFLMRKPLAVCAMDEFGAFMKRIGGRRASGFEAAISGMLRTAWSSSFKPMPTPEWAQRQAETVMSPALSIFGVSTPEEFYGALEGGDMSNGLLNRMLVIETRKRPRDRAPRLTDSALPPALVEKLKGILLSGGELAFAQLQRSDVTPISRTAEWGDGAQRAYSDLIEKVHKLCDGSAMAEAFYARGAEMALRIATILAVGVDPRRSIVTVELMQWASAFALWSAKTLERGGTEHIADSDNQSSANAVRRAIREVGGRMKHRDLLRRLNHRIKNRDLHEVIKALVEAEQIRAEKITPPNGGTPSLWYTLA